MGTGLGVDVVIESTGHLRTREAAATHLAAGARKVIVSAPIKGDVPADADVVLGVNFADAYDPEADERDHLQRLVHDELPGPGGQGAATRRSASATGQMTTIHAYTADQNLLDGPHKDLRRARAAAENLVPTSTGAAKALGLVIPELEGRLNGHRGARARAHGLAGRPDRRGRAADERGEVNAAFEAAAAAGPLEGHPRLPRGADRLLRHRRLPGTARSSTPP